MSPGILQWDASDQRGCPKVAGLFPSPKKWLYQAIPWPEGGGFVSFPEEMAVPGHPVAHQRRFRCQQQLPPLANLGVTRMKIAKPVPRKCQTSVNASCLRYRDRWSKPKGQTYHACACRHTVVIIKVLKIDQAVPGPAQETAVLVKYIHVYVCMSYKWADRNQVAVQQPQRMDLIQVNTVLLLRWALGDTLCHFFILLT